MKKIFIAGFMAACVMMAGMTASAAGRAVPRCVRGNGACHQQLNAVWKDCVRHDCTYVDADGDGICDNCSWLEGRHHCVDENGYCLNGSCNYDNCGYAHGTGYCRGYCNSLTDGGAVLEVVSSQAAVPPSEGTDVSGNGTEGTNVPNMVQGNTAAQGSADAAPQNSSAVNGAYGSGNGSGAGYNDGYWGYGHHGGGHHSGHHGCR